MIDTGDIDVFLGLDVGKGGHHVIADAARAMPHMLRAIDGEDETIGELEMIVGFDDDLPGEATRVANRLHGLLTQIPPSFEGPDVDAGSRRQDRSPDPD